MLILFNFNLWNWDIPPKPLSTISISISLKIYLINFLLEIFIFRRCNWCFLNFHLVGTLCSDHFVRICVFKRHFLPPTKESEKIHVEPEKSLMELFKRKLESLYSTYIFGCKYVSFRGVLYQPKRSPLSLIFSLHLIVSVDGNSDISTNRSGKLGGNWVCNPYEYSGGISPYLKLVWRPILYASDLLDNFSTSMIKHGFIKKIFI